MKNKKIFIFIIIFIILISIITLSIAYLKSNNLKIDYTNLSNNIVSTYNENINMEYLSNKDTELKIKNISFSDNALNLILGFKLKDTNIDYSSIKTNIIIFNESHQIYCSTSAIKSNTDHKKSFYKAEKLSENKNLQSGLKYLPLSTSNNEAIYQLVLYSPVQDFSKSEKLYIHIYGLEYVNNDGQTLTSTPEWSFSIDSSNIFTPSVKYKLKENIDGLNLNEICISNYLTTVSYEESHNNFNIKIMDSPGNEFNSLSTSSKGSNKIFSSYAFTADDITSPLFLKISNDNFSKIVELEQIK